jgi:hypothetical protein
MFVAAMVDALPWLRAPVEAALAAIKPASAPPAAFRETANGGLRALSFGLASSPAADAATHVHGNADAHRIHGSGDAEPHRQHAHGSTYAAIRDELAHAPLDAAVRRHALALLDLLADAESGVPLEVRLRCDFQVKGDPAARAEVELSAQVRAVGGSVAAVVPPAQVLPDERKARGVARALEAAGLSKKGSAAEERAEPTEEAE